MRGFKLFWIAVYVIQLNPYSDTFSSTSRITINFLELCNSHTKLFADYNTWRL